MRIALDAMGTDNYPAPDVEGAVLAAREFGCTVVLVGDEQRLKTELAHHNTVNLSIEIVHAPEVINMTDKPQDVVRNKPQSSMHIGMELVENGDCEGFVTCGNTGAAHAIATLGKIRRIRGIHRPALTALVPLRGSPFILADVGANVDCRPEWLVQFATMGSIYAERVMNRQNPRIALLSNGEEETKGNHLIQETIPLLRASGLNFIGNVEPKEMAAGVTDVLICDGFVGNIFAKTLEAMGSNIFSAIRYEVEHSIRAKIGALLMKPAFRRIYKQHDPFEIGGAPLLGVNGVVIIGHGRSNANAVKNAIRQAKLAVEGQIIEAIKEHLAKIAQSTSA
ncbi:MAG: phosphate--acyl-ACP acyltransferase [Phototrophicales bacterium]|nr:MAG: phosphate--acyl-ACP acyltransferase [Phototrophicales bacterium]